MRVVQPPPPPPGGGGEFPVPLRLTVCRPPAELSLTLKVPVRVPVVVGVNVTLMEQLEFAARLVPQVLVCEKSPVTEIPLIESAAVPVLLSVTVCGVLLLPTTTPLNVRLEGDRLAMGAVPVPERLAVCGLPTALSVTVIVPVREPVAVGLKVTWMEQFSPGAKAVPQLLVWVKSPVVLIPLMESVAPPLFVKTIVCAVLVVPTNWLEKVKPVGDNTAVCGVATTRVTFVFELRVPLVPATFKV